MCDKEIIFVDDAKQPAGGQMSLYQLAKYIENKEFNYKIFTTSKLTYEFYKGKKLNVFLYSYYQIILFSLTSKDSKYHVNTWSSALIFGFISLFVNKDVYFRVRTFSRAKWLKYLRFLFSRLNLICNSYAIAKSLYWISPRSMHVIYNYPGVSKSMLKKETDSIRFHCIGRISKRKNQLFLMKLFDEFDDPISSKVELKFFGKYSNIGREAAYVSEFRQLYERKTRKYRLKLDYTEEQQYLFDCDFLLVPHFHEPLGRVLMEAQLYQVPVIALNEGGNPEVISEGQNGYLLSRDPQEWKNRILTIINDDQTNRSYKFFPDKFNVDNTLLSELKVIMS